METEIMRFMIGDERVDVDLSDINGLEWREVKKLTGMTPGQIMNAGGELDFEALGAVVWVVMKRDEPRLVFESVLKKLSLRSFITPDAEDEADEEGDIPNPE